jgi:hypothetical protein
VVDETLDVDLGFLVNSNYTIFVVERRWADYPSRSTSGEYFLGTAVPATVEQKGASAWCTPGPVNETLQFGYSYTNSDIILGADQGCGAGLIAIAASVPGSPPAPLSEDTLSFDNTRGHELWANGVPVAANVDTSALSYADGGAIGRASLVTTMFGYDMRFRGDIAEVLVYDTALDSPNQVAIETYLRAHWAF